MTSCGFTGADRRRTFWTTQPDPCPGSVDSCGTVCSGPGLRLMVRCDEVRQPCGDTPNMDAPCTPRSLCDQPRTIDTSDWVRGLALNMLLTDARLPDTCRGWRAGARGGHWSESFIEGGRPIGTRLRSLPAAGKITDLKALITSAVKETLTKLVDYGVASSIEVETAYRGARAFAVTVTIFGTAGVSTKVGISATAIGDTLSWAA